MGILFDLLYGDVGMISILVSIDGEEWFELPNHTDSGGNYRYIIVDEDITDERYELFIRKWRERDNDNHCD